MTMTHKGAMCNVRWRTFSADGVALDLFFVARRGVVVYKVERFYLTRRRQKHLPFIQTPLARSHYPVYIIQSSYWFELVLRSRCTIVIMIVQLHYGVTRLGRTHMYIFCPCILQIIGDSCEEFCPSRA